MSPVKKQIQACFSLQIWRLVVKQALHQSHWPRSAAIAYGLVICLLSSFLSLSAAAALSPEFKLLFVKGIAWCHPGGVEPIQNLVTHLAAEGEPWHRWFLLVAGSAVAVGLGVKSVGTVQLILRTARISGPSISPSMQHRLITMGLTLAGVPLLLLTYSLMAMTLPSTADPSVVTAFPWQIGRDLLIQALRWSLAMASLSLLFGLIYRFSMPSSQNSYPLLPGTILATLIWTTLAVLIKAQSHGLQESHWLYSVVGMTILSLFSLQGGTLGVLLGGSLNGLMHRYVPQPRSRSPAAPTPAPSFESFKIQRPSHRNLR